MALSTELGLEVGPGDTAEAELFLLDRVEPRVKGSMGQSVTSQGLPILAIMLEGQVTVGLRRGDGTHVAEQGRVRSVRL
jgi:hypothetical protein